MSVSDIGGNADLFRAAYPSWPHPEPGAAEGLTSPLEDLGEAAVAGGLMWTASGPGGRVWAISWRESLGDVRACPASGGLYGPRGVAATEVEARSEALRIAGLIAAGKARDER